MGSHRFRRPGRSVLCAVALAVTALCGVAGVRAQEPPPAVPAAQPAEQARVAIGEAPPADVVLRKADTTEARDLADAGLLRVAELPPAAGRPVVLIWWSTRCPVCARYAATVRALSADIDGLADVVLVVTVDDTDEAGLSAVLEEQELSSFAVLRDTSGAAARLAVRVSPTALVFDAEGVLRYRGPLDDDRRARGRDARPLLVPAVRALAEGRDIESAEARPFGSALR